MNMRMAAMIVLMLFHASSAWAASMPVDQCPGQMQEISAEQHQYEQMTDAGCCDDINTLACQLHCAGAVPCLTEVTMQQTDVLPPAMAPALRLGQRLPPHHLSLLRPPRPLS